MTTYRQRLEQITGGRVPEEGDFNTARLTASDTPLSVRQAIQEELQSVDHCVSDQDEYDEEYDDLDLGGHVADNGELHSGHEINCYDCNP